MTAELTRSDYDHKFVCSQCVETIFVFGEAPDSSVCAVCRGADDPGKFRFHEGLRALIAQDGDTSVQCIYLDAEGKSEHG